MGLTNASLASDSSRMYRFISALDQFRVHLGRLIGGTRIVTRAIRSTHPGRGDFEGGRAEFCTVVGKLRVHSAVDGVHLRKRTQLRLMALYSKAAAITPSAHRRKLRSGNRKISLDVSCDRRGFIGSHDSSVFCSLERYAITNVREHRYALGGVSD